MLTVKEAQKIILDNIRPSYIEQRPVIKALGMSLCDDIVSDRDYPPYDRATMDGFAIKSLSINKHRIKDFHIKAKTLAGSPPFLGRLSKKDCVSITTGSKMPLHADAVIPVEKCRINDSAVAIDLKEIKSGLNIAKQGEDIGAGDLVIPKATIVDHSLVSLLASFGYPVVRVYSPPTISIISTGDEIIDIDKKPLDYQIRDSNSYVMRALLKSSLGIEANYLSLVKDNKEDLEKVIKNALKSDIVIISGGVSMGEADFVPSVLEGLAVKKIFHKVKIKPGKPIWFGSSERSVVFGLPGNPLSCQICYKLFIEPYIRQFMNLSNLEVLEYRLVGDRTKRTDREDYFPCRIDYRSGELSPLRYSGSGDIKAGFGSDGFARHPAESSFIAAGTTVRFYPWVSR